MRRRWWNLIATLALVGTAPLWLSRTCNVQWALLGHKERALVRLKNRTTLPADKDFDRRVTLPALLARGVDDTRWSAERAAALEGFVVSVKPGAVEFANCLSFTERDIHIDLAMSANAAPPERVIVEVTPYWRQWAAARGLDWSVEALSHVVGRRVRVEGWLFFDAAHAEESENVHPAQWGNWRATAWELHPITAFHALD